MMTCPSSEVPNLLRDNMIKLFTKSSGVIVGINPDMVSIVEPVNDEHTMVETKRGSYSIRGHILEVVDKLNEKDED